MFKVIKRNGRHGWFVRYARGNLSELLPLMPCALDFIAFCRNNDGVMRECDTARFMQVAARLTGKQGI
jgi:hypothetical protein